MPIGLVNLASMDARCIQHRRSELGVNIIRSYQRQGYGTEAIEWALNWGFQCVKQWVKPFRCLRLVLTHLLISFRYAGLHRIEINAFAYNTGAVQLYQRIGFVQEGRRRDFLFHNGKFWDFVSFSMLEDEWRQRRDNGK